MPESLVPTLLAPFATLEDPRIERTKRYNLLDLLFIALCAVVSGANDCVAMEKFGKSKRVWLEKYLSLPDGMPCHDTFNRVFAAIDGAGFVACFLKWVEALQESTDGQLVAIDGKTARATLDRVKGKNPLHIVSAWVAANRLFLGQEVVDEKSNEITAIPKLLAVLELTGAIITIDAMGCQKEIAAQIREKKAHYVLAAKGNQAHLEEDVIAAFAAADDGQSPPTLRTHTEHAKGHGRIETRRTQVMAAPATLRNLEEWKDLTTIARCTRSYTENGIEKSEVRYFISSLPAEVKKIARAIRGHWGIENGLHWVLDMYFAEDRNRARTGHAAANLGLLRRWVLSLLQRNKSISGGIEKKRLQAAWNDGIRENLLGLFVEI
jgi:predicted transposase YbfD/YdcC